MGFYFIHPLTALLILLTLAFSLTMLVFLSLDPYSHLLLLRCGDVELNPGPVRSRRHTCRVLYSNIRGLFANLKDVSVVSLCHDVIICAETLVSDYRHDSELMIPGFSKPLFIRRSVAKRRRGMSVHIREGFSAHRKTKYECTCHETVVIRVCAQLQNFYILGSYRNPDSDDTIFDCLLMAMAMIQDDDRKAAFVFAGDYNAHHREWLESVSPTDSHGRAALDFANVSGCSQLVVGPTHLAGNRLDLVFTDVPETVKVTTMAPLGTSDHSAISIQLNLRQNIPAYTVTKEVFLKGRVNWSSVREDVSRIRLGPVLSNPDPVSALNEELKRIISRRVPVKKVCLRSNDKAWFNIDCRTARDTKQAAYRRWSHLRTRETWVAYTVARASCAAVYRTAESEYFTSAKEKLSTASDPHKWWSTLKSVVFGLRPSLPALLSDTGQLITSPKGKADLLMKHFDSKLCRAPAPTSELPPAMPVLTKLAFRSKEVMRLLLALDSHGGTDPLGMFPMFLKETAAVLAPKLSAVFRRLILTGSFPMCWRNANITAIPKGSPSSDASNYRPISITPLLSKIFEHVISGRLSRYLEHSHLIPANQFAYRKNLGTTDALLTISHKIQQALDCGHEARVVQLDFSAAFDRVNHAGLLRKLQSFGVGGPVLSILTQFLTHRTHRVCVDSCYSDWYSVHSGVPQGSVLGPLLFNVYTSDLLQITSNPIYGYADDVTLVATVESPNSRLDVSTSLNEDLRRISDWCRTWNMKLNASKSKCLCISRSRTLNPLHGPLLVDGAPLTVCDELDILGVRFDSKLSFERHIRRLVSSASQKLGVVRKAYRIFGDQSISASCFRCFILPLLEYCAPVWSSAAVSHLRLIDRVVSSARFLCGGEAAWDLGHRRNVSSVCMLYKIHANQLHPLNASIPNAFVPTRNTRLASNSHARCLQQVRCHTSQFQRSFVPCAVRLWNMLDEGTCTTSDVQKFKSASNKILKSLVN